MKLYILVGVLAALAGGSFAQQPTQETPAATPNATNAGPSIEPAPELPCAKDDALCVLAQSLKKKDPGTGSKSGISPGFIAAQPPIPGGRLDLEFLQKNEIKG
jgi:hypothetical protein